MGVFGADNFINMQSEKLRKAPDKVFKILQDTANSTRSQAVRIAPVRTGFLRNSIRPEMVINGTKMTATVYGNAYSGSFNYGYAQEYGTKYVRPKYFITTAFEAHKELFRSRLKEVING